MTKASEADIDISVVVSQELRHLLRPTQHPLIDDIFKAPSTSHAAMNSTDTNDRRHTNWGKIVLRRDGGRPLSFFGLRLWSKISSVVLHNIHLSQTVTLFVTDTYEVYLGYIVEWHGACGNQPIHRCIKLHAPSIQDYLPEWQKEAFERLYRYDPKICKKPPVELTTEAFKTSPLILPCSPQEI